MKKQQSKSENDQHRDLTIRQMVVRSKSINEEDRSFEAVVATDTPAAVFDYRNWEIIDEILVSRGGEFPDHVPLLPNHRRYDVLDVIGSATNFRMEGGQWIGRGQVAKAANDNDDVEIIWRRVADGHIRAVSIGYELLNYVDIPAGKKQSVAGKEYEAGEKKLRITTNWRVHEVSLTPIGADSKALIRSQEGVPPRKNRSYFR